MPGVIFAPWVCVHWSSEGKVIAGLRFWSVSLAVQILQHRPLRWTTHELILANCVFSLFHKINSFCWGNLFTFMFGEHFSWMFTNATWERTASVRLSSWACKKYMTNNSLIRTLRSFNIYSYTILATYGVNLFFLFIRCIITQNKPYTGRIMLVQYLFLCNTSHLRNLFFLYMCCIITHNKSYTGRIMDEKW